MDGGCDMSLSAMKQALEALKWINDEQAMISYEAVMGLRQAIAEAEKQEPVAWIVDGEIKVRLDMAGKLYYSETNVYTSPVHASDMSQECVDETAKHGHEPVAWREVAGKTTQYYDYNEDGRGEPLYLHREWVGLDGDIPGLGLVTEEFYNGMLCAEDILRKRNT